MNNQRKTSVNIISYAFWLFLMTVTSLVHAIDVTVQDENAVPIAGFKWTLEENRKSDVVPGVQTEDSLSLSFHNSYSPVLASGECTAPPCSIPVSDTTKKYFVSVLPFTGHTLGGATFSGSDGAVTVDVHTHAIPTAQITVRVFQDNHPINGAPDDPEEQVWPPIDVNTGLPTTGQFTVHLADAGGRYGATGGEIIQDAFGNPLGTDYVPGSPGVVGPGGYGTGFLIPDADGFVHIKYIPPAKYGVTVIPPTGGGWIQTSTLEGTKTIDAWVMANEPEFFAEFGPPGPHVNIGFTQEFTGPDLIGAGSVTGTITNNHMARPPEVGFFSSWPFGGCWVGLNETVAAGGQALYAKPCAADSSFNIPGIPDGIYDLVVWDVNLDIVIATRTVTLAGTEVALGEVPVFDWFGRTEQKVFLDTNENGFRDPGEEPIPEQATGFRFRNGTPYQGFATDLGGEAPYDEVFPFFHWLVAEVDYARYKATGVTYVVDNGGDVPVDDGWTMPSFDVLNPQPQLDLNPNTGNALSTTITGPVISLASQLFLGQTNVIEWGKALYGMQDVDNFPYGNFPGTEDVDNNPGVDHVPFEYGNGGISGLALYAITRAENDPRYAAAEEWEPGIPRIQLNLYKDFTGDGNIDDIDGDGLITLADTDNAPQGNFPGAEDVDRNANGFFDYGDALQVTTSDSWDDSLPTGCIPGAGGAFVAHPGTGIEKVTDCYDGLRNFNQLREGVYDGGYAFTSRIARDIGTDPDTGVPTTGGVATNLALEEVPDEVPGLVAGYYIVESAVPDGYVLMKEEDKNVDFGDEFVVPAQLPPICVGDDHIVPQYLSFQTDSSGSVLTGVTDPIAAPYAGLPRPLCDRKQIALTAGKNAAADFFMFTQAPVAAHVVGGILNDLGNEFDPNNPNFGEKFAPSWVPVIFYDWTGKMVTKVYADEFGKYEALVPSTYTVNAASPTGMSPNMLNACMNDPGPDNDAFYNPQFSTFCYVFQYMPGSTTYLDTPVVPVSAFANAGGFPIDCAIPDNYPLIKSVDGPAGFGPVLPDGLTDGGTLTITSEGMLDVPNYLFGAPGEPITIQRNYGFGATAGSVFIGDSPVTVDTWSNVQIDITVPAGVATGQLVVTTASGNKAPRSVTVTTHLPTTRIHEVTTGTIQAAIDGAADGDLVLLSPGAYSELVIMDKPVQIQGYGAGVTSISAIRNPATKLSDWRLEIATRAGAGTGTGSFDYLPNQQAGFLAEEGPGIIVLGQASGNFTQTLQPRIDGIEISSALSGGAIFVNGYVDFLDISNNKITGNEGTYGGGIRIGNPAITQLVGIEPDVVSVHVSSDNDSINIHDNEVVFNGTTFGPAGGIGLYTGANDYTVDHNFICGNFAQDHGAGIAHLGLSDNGVISNNTIAFNQNFNQARNVHGGGLFIGGQPGLAPLETEGSGSVVVEANLIQGNSAGAGLGGGIMLSLINGIDIINSTNAPVDWYGIDIFDNMIVNNHAGWTGAGIAMQDAAKVRIINNTIAHNEATATVGNLFVIDTVAQTATSQPQVGAGIASFAHSGVLATNAAPQTFSNPELVNDIIWENRTFSWFADLFADPQFGLVPGVAPDFPDGFSDLGVIGAAGVLTTTSSILTGGALDPGFILDYFNTGRSQTILQTEQTANTLIGIAVALDEGGNFVDVQYGPLSILGNYHLRTDSAAINVGADMSTIAQLAFDIDGEARALATPFDIGADEVVVATDTDGDGVVDTQDNCTLVANPAQRDTDGDNYGNYCDGDLDNDLTVNLNDLFLFRGAFGTADPDADFDGDTFVNLNDLFLFRGMFGSAPGPSGLVN